MSALPWDIGPICGTCGTELAVPAREHALLDERGMAHVLCTRCGSENVIQFELPTPQLRMTKWRGAPGSAAALIWLVIIGMILLLIPVYRSVIQSPPKEEPTRFLLT